MLNWQSLEPARTSWFQYLYLSNKNDSEHFRSQHSNSWYKNRKLWDISFARTHALSWKLARFSRAGTAPVKSPCSSEFSNPEHSLLMQWSQYQDFCLVSPHQNEKYCRSREPLIRSVSWSAWFRKKWNRSAFFIDTPSEIYNLDTGHVYLYIHTYAHISRYICTHTCIIHLITPEVLQLSCVQSLSETESLTGR